MKKLRNLIAMMAMMSMAAVLTGCGDDDDNDDDDQPPGQQVFAPLDEAALTAQNKTYTVNVAGQEPITLTFPAAGQYQTVQGGVTEVGTIANAVRDVNRWTMDITPNEGQDGAQAGVLQLDFTAENAGTATFTPTGGQAETGTFTVTTTGNGDGGGDGGDNGGGGLPADLINRTLQVNYPGGGGEKFQFTSDTAVSYEDGAETGTYTYSQQDGRVTVALGNGWSYDITLQEGGNATVFFKQNEADPGTTDSATYTLN
jgi:hypothetical protein